MYEKCWKRLQDELNHCAAKGTKSLDPRLLLAYMDSIVDLERQKARNWQLTQKVLGDKGET